MRRAAERERTHYCRRFSRSLATSSTRRLYVEGVRLGWPRQEKAGPRPPRGRAYPSGEYSRLKTAPWVRVLRYTESAGWMEP